MQLRWRIEEARGDFAFAAVNNANNWRTQCCEKNYYCALKPQPRGARTLDPQEIMVNECLEDTPRTHAAHFLCQELRLMRISHFGPLFNGMNSKMSRTCQIRTTHCWRVCAVSWSARLLRCIYGWVSVCPLTPWVGQLSFRDGVIRGSENRHLCEDRRKLKQGNLMINAENRKTNTLYIGACVLMLCCRKVSVEADLLRYSSLQIEIGIELKVITKEPSAIVYSQNIANVIWIIHARHREQFIYRICL